MSILFLLATQAIISQRDLRLDWEKINSVDGKGLIILSINSKEEFILRDNKMNLYLYKKGNVQKFESPIPNSFTRPVMSSLINGKFYLTAMDEKWHTHFYFFSNGRWEKDKLVHELPIQKFVSGKQDIHYIIGNFGTLFKYKDGKWNEIITPIKSHINFGEIKSDSSLYLLSNSDGLFTYKNEKFTKSKIHTDSLNLIFMTSYQDRIYFSNSFNQKFELHENRLLKIDNYKRPYQIFLDDLGLQKIKLGNDKEEQVISIPPEVRISDFRILSKDQFLITTSSGEIYLAEPTDKIIFSNLAKEYGIDGEDGENHMLSSLYDFNNDGISDIFQVVYNRGYKADLAFSKKNKLFSNNGKNLEIINNLGWDNLRIVDLDNDEYPEICVSNLTPNGSYIKIFKYLDSQFGLSDSIKLPDKFNNIRTRSITPVDIDIDGDLDLCISNYYGPGSETGHELFLINKWYGKQWDIDSTHNSVTKGWNINSIFADFNNDGKNDWFIINKWRRAKLLIYTENGFKDESSERLENNDLTEDNSAVAADLDNDGDLDLILSSDQYPIRFYINNGLAYFEDKTDEMVKLNYLGKHVTGNSSSVNVGDLNNDSYLDIIFNDESFKNNLQIYINDKGQRFINSTNELGIISGKVNKIITTDINDDGDLDILQLSSGKNKLWDNNLNEKNFIKIRLIGVDSNHDAIGSKIWLYQNSRDSLKLVGYRQIGSFEFDLGTQSSFSALFGVEPGYTYEAVVSFYGSDTVFVNNIKAGESLIVSESDGLKKFIHKLPSKVYWIIVNKEIQAYFLLLIFTIIVLLSGIKLGLKLFNWGISLVTFLTSISISIMWLLVILTHQSEILTIKYGLPAAFAVGSMVIPFVVFFITGSTLNVKINKKNLEEELLQLLITFSHGEWALRNINSLQLFFQNYSTENFENEKYARQVFNRINTFLDLTQTNLQRMIDLCKILKIENGKIEELQSELNAVLNFLRNNKEIDKLKEIGHSHFEKTATNLFNIKQRISDLRHEIYKLFSCNPVIIISQVISVFETKFIHEKINFNFITDLDTDYFVLISKNELADAIDNLITNAIRAMKNSDKKDLTIRIYRHVPKIHIEVKDTGIGIEKEIWTTVFERGFSQNKSTGEGLYSVKNSLEKFGSRISIKQSKPAKGTTFIIELLEGIRNETTSINN